MTQGRLEEKKWGEKLNIKGRERRVKEDKEENKEESNTVSSKIWHKVEDYQEVCMEEENYQKRKITEWKIVKAIRKKDKEEKDT